MKHYIRLIFRKINPRPLYPGISILGLIIGFIAVVLVGTWLRDELSYDKFHSQSERIYRLTVEEENQKTGFHWDFARSRISWLKNIKNDVPGIESLVRISRWNKGIVKVGNSIWNEEIFYADSSIFDVFSFQFLKGGKEDCLSQPDRVILSESWAKKYFGNDDPTGQIIYLYCNSCQEQKPYEVTGVFRDYPTNSHVHFNVLASYTNPDDVSWAYYYILLNEGVNPDNILSEFETFARKYTNNEDYLKTLTPHLQNIADIHLLSSKERELEVNGNIREVFLIAGLAVLVLCITLFNFFNLRYVMLLKELKSVQVLKYAGAGRKSIYTYQFLESFLYTICAAIVAFLIVYLAYPYFNLIMGKQMSSGLSLLVKTSGTLLSGLIIISSFIGILPYLTLKLSGVIRSWGKGSDPDSIVTSSNFRNKFSLLKSLIGLQYVGTFVLIVSLIAVSSQVKFFMDHRLGNNAEKVICLSGIPCQVVDKYQVFKNELLKNPLIKDVTSSMENPGYEIMDMMGFDTVSIDDETAQKLIYVSPVDDNFFQFYNINLVAGETFPPFSGDNSRPENYILNEQAVKYLGWTNEEAIGKPFRLKNRYTSEKPGKVVGIVKDFQPSSMRNKIKPYAFFQKSFWLYSAQIKCDTSKIAGSIAYISDKWNTIYPDFPFEYEFVDDMYNHVYQSEIQLKNLSIVLSILALILSSIGLFGITGMVYQTKVKEIGIRKVNGANQGEISKWLLKDITTVVLLSFVLAVPVSYFLMNKWLERYANRIDLGVWIFLSGSLIVLLIALLTVSWQTWKASVRNPVEALRYE